MEEVCVRASFLGSENGEERRLTVDAEVAVDRLAMDGRGVLAAVVLVLVGFLQLIALDLRAGLVCAVSPGQIALFCRPVLLKAHLLGA